MRRPALCVFVVVKKTVHFGANHGFVFGERGLAGGSITIMITSNSTRIMTTSVPIMITSVSTMIMIMITSVIHLADVSLSIVPHPLHVLVHVEVLLEINKI